MPETFTANAGPVPQAVLFNSRRMARPILLPVVRILLAPLSGTVSADVAVLGIGGDLGAVVVGASAGLTRWLATDFLAGWNLDGWNGLWQYRQRR